MAWAVVQLNRVADWQRRIRGRLGTAVYELPTRVARVCALGVVVLSVMSLPVAAAPLDDVGSAMCGSGLGQLFGLVLAAVAVYLLAKGVFRGMMAFDKMGSSRSETQFEGKEQLAGAGKTAAGAFIPTLAAGIFEVIGISMISCFNLDIGIMTIAMPLPL